METVPVIVSVQNGEGSAASMSGQSWQITSDPPQHPNSTIPVTCPKPGVGMVACLPQYTPYHLWICVGELTIIERTEGIATAALGMWRPNSAQETVKESVRWFSPETPLHVSDGMDMPTFIRFPIPPGHWDTGDAWWWDNDLLVWWALNHPEIDALLHWEYYHNTVCTFDPCASPGEENAKWRQMYEDWKKIDGQPAYAEWFRKKLCWAPLETWKPFTGTLLPLYAGTMGVFDGIFGGGQSSAQGGAMGLLALAGALAGLMGVSSATATAAGRVLEQSDHEESVEWGGEL